MRMSFRKFVKLDERLGSFVTGGRTTGLPLDAPSGWEFPDMHEPVTMSPRIGGQPWATSFSQAAQLGVREDLMMKLNTLQRMANVVKSLVSYKLDPHNKDKAHTGKTVVNLDYEFVPPLTDPDCKPGKCKILGVDKKDILSSGLQTHGLQINPAEIGYLEESGILRSNPMHEDKYDISTYALVKEMTKVRDQYQEKLKTGQGLDMAVGGLEKMVQKGSSGKLSLSRAAS